MTSGAASIGLDTWVTPAPRRWFMRLGTPTAVNMRRVACRAIVGPPIPTPGLSLVRGYYLEDELYKASSHGHDELLLAYLISDYTFGALYDRIKAIKSQRSARSTDSNVRTARLSGAQWGDGSWRDDDCLGASGRGATDARVDGRFGRRGQQATGYFYPFSHIDGGIVLTEDPRLTWLVRDSLWATSTKPSGVLDSGVTLCLNRRMGQD